MNASATSAPVTVVTLRTLRDKPFELLRELERLARVALAGQGRDAANEREWVGVAFRMSSENFLVAREETREVLGFPSVVTRVPGAKPWIRGIANVRGQLLPIVDLRAFLGGGVTSVSRSSRVLVANHREVPAGLLVDEVQGFRRFADNEFGTMVPPTIVRCERYLAGAFRRGPDSWPVFSLRSLLESTEFLQAAAS
ncbi:MAG TPA: chemotaxis protein CheW [Povalibacter sp.]